MRTIPAPLAAHIAEDVTTLAVCWRVERADGVLILGTEHDRDLVVTSGDYAGTYAAGAGITGSDVRSTSDMSVDNMEVAGAVNQGDLSLVDLSAADIEAGLFDGASVVLFLVNWQAPDDGQIVLRTGTIGEIRRTAEGEYRTELRGLAQALTQNVVRTYGSSCDAELGDFRCKIPLGDITFDGEVTAVAGGRDFTALIAVNSPEVDDDYFNGGVVTWESGHNAGYQMEVKLAEPNAPASTVETFTTSGSWVVPAGVTSAVVECWGGGGSGGGNIQTTRDGGGGGGGGAYAKSTIALTPGATINYQVGAGGICNPYTSLSPDDSKGQPGGDTWFVDSSTVMAKGGGGGSRGAASTGGAGGAGGSAAASIGDVKYSGGTGGAGRTSTTGRGGPGGSSAGTAADGLSGPTPWNITSLASAGPAGSGIGGNGANISSGPGFAPASGNGGGGGGSSELTTVADIGGPGAAGKIVVTYFEAATTDVELYLPMPADIEVGDTFTIRPGCDKSAAMCKGRFANLVNFRGHGAWVPGVSELMTFGGQTAEKKPRSSSFLAWPREVEP